MTITSIQTKGKSLFLDRIAIVLLFCAFLFLAILVRYNFLLFHVVGEGYSVFISLLLFFFVLNLKLFSKNRLLLTLSSAYLFVGLIDFLHMLTYKGMNLIPGTNTNTSIQLWLAARWIEAVAFYMPLLFRNKKNVLSLSKMLSVFGVITLLLLLIIFNNYFPICFVEGLGLTRFKILNEYILILLFLTAAAIYYKNRKDYSVALITPLIISLVFTAFSEYLFTLYTDAYGFYNILGHFFKFISIYLVYKALIKSSFLVPVINLYSTISAQEKQLQEVEQHLNSLVRDKTRELRISNKRLKAEVIEKQVVMNEVAHRTRNNLQLINSILEIKGHTVSENYTDIQAKIQSIALVQQMIYFSKSTVSFQLLEYLQKLSELTLDVYAVRSKVDVSIRGEQIGTSLDIVIPVGLVCSELLINSIRHAFSERERGKIFIELNLRDQHAMQLNYRDNGSGLPTDFSFNRSTKIGLKSIESIVVDQLGGVVRISPKEGFSIMITIPLSGVIDNVHQIPS